MRRYLITGASRGIGRAIAVRLAEKGKLLLLHGRDRAALQRTCQLVKAKGGESQILIAELSSVKGVERLLRQIGQKPVQVLVNNAGVAYVKPVSKITLSEWQENLAVNLSAPFLLIQKLLPQMKKGCTIVNILSVAAQQGFANWSSYCATKFALEGLSLCLREELRPRGIRVVNIYPKATRTGLWKKVSGKWPVEKMMEPEEVAEAVYYALTRPSHIQVENILLGNVAGNL
jgi:short-subunit dehydrogenase